MNWLAVAFGGALGATARYALTLWLPFVPGKFPLATFLANLLGCFLMGACFVLIAERAGLPAYARQVVMVGFLGALTTFSTFAMDSLHLLLSGHWKLALTYSLLSVFVCILATYAAYAFFSRVI